MLCHNSQKGADIIEIIINLVDIINLVIYINILIFKIFNNVFKQL